jgi:RNA-splicing ligase RtcB
MGRAGRGRREGRAHNRSLKGAEVAEEAPAAYKDVERPQDCSAETVEVAKV